MYLGNFIIVFIFDIGLCDNLFNLCFLIVKIFCLILARKLMGTFFTEWSDLDILLPECTCMWCSENNVWLKCVVRWNSVFFYFSLPSDM